MAREIKQVMNDEECGYTVNRENESIWRCHLNGRFLSMIDMLTSDLSKAKEEANSVVIGPHIHSSWLTTTILSSMTMFSMK